MIDPVVTTALDRYVLGEPVSKAETIAIALRERSDAEAAGPFYRALEAVGVRAADEAFVALRLVLAAREPSDVAVRRLRALGRVARASAMGDARGLETAFSRDREALADLPKPTEADATEIGNAARSAYARELAP